MLVGEKVIAPMLVAPLPNTTIGEIDVANVAVPSGITPPNQEPARFQDEPPMAPSQVASTARAGVGESDEPMTMQQSNAEAGRVRRYNLSTLSMCPPSSLMQPIRNPDFTGDSGCLGRDATPR